MDSREKDLRKRLKDAQEQQTRLEAQQALLLDLLAKFWPYDDQDKQDGATVTVPIEDLPKWVYKRQPKGCALHVYKTPEKGYSLRFEPVRENHDGVLYFRLYLELMSYSDRLKEANHKVETLEDIIKSCY